MDHQSMNEWGVECHMGFVNPKQSLGGSLDLINTDGLTFSPNRGQKTSPTLLVLAR